MNTTARARRNAAPGCVTSFDAAEAEERYAAEPVDDLSPDRLFQRRWALTLLESTLRLLGEEFARAGQRRRSSPRCVRFSVSAPSR